MLRSKDKPHNFPIYAFDTKLGSSILFNESVDSGVEEMRAENQHSENLHVNNKEMEGWWSLYFDGSTGK